MTRGGINLDWNATWGLLPEVEASLKRSSFNYLNPSSIHQGGQTARAIIEEARDAVRQTLALPPGTNCTFTSGATEANNTALLIPFWHRLSVQQRGDSFAQHSVVISSVEHPSIVEAAERLKAFGIEVRTVGARSGTFYPDDFADAVDDTTRLVSVMLVNNETGWILPVPEIARAVKNRRSSVIVHSDCAQAIGKIPLHFESLGVDALSISGHKIGALAGVGALITARGLGVDPFLVGGPQEVRRRAGTENVLGIHSLGIALREAGRALADWAKRSSWAYDTIKNFIETNIPSAVIQFSEGPHVGNTLSVRFPGILTSDLVVALDLEGILVSSGSACASGKPEPSPVLTALGLTDIEAQETVRISVGHMLSEQEVADACVAIARCTARMWGRRAA